MTLNEIPAVKYPEKDQEYFENYLKLLEQVRIKK